MNKLCVPNFDSVESSMLKLHSTSVVVQFSTFFSCCFLLLLVRNSVNSWSISHFPQLISPGRGLLIASFCKFHCNLKPRNSVHFWTTTYRGSRVAQGGTNVARVQILLLTPYVGWVYWSLVPSLALRGFPRAGYLDFTPPKKTTFPNSTSTRDVVF